MTPPALARGDSATDALLFQKADHVFVRTFSHKCTEEGITLLKQGRGRTPARDPVQPWFIRISVYKL